MKIPAYTRDKNVFDARASNNQHVVEKSQWQKTRSFVQKKYESQLAYITWGLQNVPDNFSVGVFMADIFKKYNCSQILSLGSGDAYMEFAMKKKLPELILKITDFDDLLIRNLQKILKRIGTYYVVDIKKDNFTKFYNKIDTVFIAATFYVLSDEEAVDFFRRLSNLKPKNIFIVAVAYLWPEDIFKYIISRYLGGSFIGKLKTILTGTTIPEKPPGRFHGWTRSQGEFKKILAKEGSFKLRKVYRYKNNPHDHAILHIVHQNG